MKAFLRWLVRWLYGFKAYNTEVLTVDGPVLLIPNHVSWLDWLFLWVCLDEDWKYVVSSVSAETSWVHRKIMLNRRTFPIDTLSPFSAKQMAEHLRRKGRLVLFAEGRISRTGGLMKLFEGTGFLLHRTEAKVITCYLRGASRLPFSPNPNAKRWFPRVTAHFSEILRPPQAGHIGSGAARRQLTSWVRERMVEQQFATEMRFGPRSVLAGVVETARWRAHKLVLEDMQRRTLTYRQLLAGVAALARLLDKHIPPAEERIGVLLPNVVTHPLLVLSLWTVGKVPAVLNFSTGLAAMLACGRLAGLKRILTARSFVERFQIDVPGFEKAGLQLVYLEDLRARLGWREKLAAWFQSRWRPGSLLDRVHGWDETAVVLFTSGSEGLPKGVELSHRNLLANMWQILSVIDILDTDRFFTALPLFHSYGLTVGTLLPLLRGVYVFLYPSPLHYRMVPTVVYNLDATVMFGTNTFLNGYARKAHPYDFRTLRYLVAGAEKLQETTSNTWMRRFGVRVIEGYGATECSPVMTVNTPVRPKHASAGRFLPGMEFRLEPVEGVTEGGRLFVRGPNVMKGYLNPEANAKFQALNGWYDTGDIVQVDEEGFVHILGRLKRFAKVSGEMISLAAIEDALTGAFPQYGLRCHLAVLSRPDQDKGEILIAVTNEPRLRLEEIRAALRASGFSNLAVPRELKVLREIPVLGTGKTNHRELATMI